MTEQIKVYRVIEYRGTEAAVRRQLDHSLRDGSFNVGNDLTVSVRTLTEGGLPPELFNQLPLRKNFETNLSSRGDHSAQATNT